MLEVFEQHKLDLFHVHYAIPHAVSAFLAREMSGRTLRFATTPARTDITVVGADPAYMRPTKFALDQSDAVTAVSHFLADETRLIFGFKKPIRVIHNFVDTERYKPGQTNRFRDRQGEERVIVHASNFRPVKRVADVVRAFARSRRSCRHGSSCAAKGRTRSTRSRSPPTSGAQTRSSRWATSSRSRRSSRTPTSSS
jgi:glycosyltransferase involved in cell wall biosynthesis